MTYSCISFFQLFSCCFKILWLVWCYECLERFSMLVWIGMYGCCRETVVRSDNLAQASLSRLGEIGKDSPRPFSREGSLRWLAQFWVSECLAQRGETRLSENARRLLFCVSSSCLGEGSSPERETLLLERDPSAWAKSWARVRLGLVFSLSLDVWLTFEWIII